MNNKPNEVLVDQTSIRGESQKGDRNTLQPKVFSEELLVGQNLLNLDPRILQRYSIDDNGGGYKGL